SAQMMSAKRSTVRRDDSRVELSAVLDGSLLGFVIDVHDSESLRVSVRPLIVVEQRPGVVSAQIHTLLDRIVRSLEMTHEVVDALRILDPSVDCGRWLRPRRSVFSDVDRNVSVTRVDPLENISERSGIYLPAHVRMRIAVLGNSRNVEDRSLPIVLDYRTSVVVDSYEIDRLADELHFIIGGRNPRVAKDFLELVRISAEEDRIEKLAVAPCVH